MIKATITRHISQDGHDISILVCESDGIHIVHNHTEGEHIGDAYDPENARQLTGE